MPRLRNTVTGAVVSVSESTASRLGSAWTAADQPRPEPEAPKRRSRKSDDD